MTTPAPSGAPARPSFTLHWSGHSQLTVTRLWDGDTRELGPWTQSIEPDEDHRYFSNVGVDWNGPRLPAVHLAAEELLGPSSPYFDDYKCSFRFPVFLTTTQGERPVRFVAKLGDLRGSVYLDLAQILDSPRNGFPRVLAAADAPLSRLELNALTDCLIRGLHAYGRAIAHRGAAFYRVVESQRLIYGLHEGELFQRELPDGDRFQEALSVVKRDTAKRDQQRQRDRFDQLLRELEATPVAHRL